MRKLLALLLALAATWAQAGPFEVTGYPGNGTLCLVGPCTLSNTRTIERYATAASNAAPTINTDTLDIYELTAQAVGVNFSTKLSGTPNAGDVFEVMITDNGTAQAITWGTSFEASTVALPTTTVISTKLSVVFQWNTATSRWRCAAVF